MYPYYAAPVCFPQALGGGGGGLPHRPCPNEMRGGGMAQERPLSAIVDKDFSDFKTN